MSTPAIAITFDALADVDQQHATTIAVPVDLADTFATYVADRYGTDPQNNALTVDEAFARYARGLFEEEMRRALKWAERKKTLAARALIAEGDTLLG